MTDQNNLARLVRDPSTGEMEWLKPSIDDLDLASLPGRLDDTMLARVEDIARRPLCALPPCDSRLFGQTLRMMLAVLPRRQADDLSGELFVAAYERQLAHYPDDAITFLCDEAVRTCRWFPTVSECLEILARWKRRDAAVKRQAEAERLARQERFARRTEPPARGVVPKLTQADCENISPLLRRIGLEAGYLIENEDGSVSPAPDAA